jgi:predicted nucleic acid-binding protein
MPQRVCVDASLAIKVIIPEPYSDRAISLWESWVENDVERIAPPFFPFEVASVIRGKYVRRQLASEEARSAFDIFTHLGFTLLMPEELLKEAWEMAWEFGLPTLYDTAYLALAKLYGCEFWTADESLINSLKDKFPWVRWIGEQF